MAGGGTESTAQADKRLDKEIGGQKFWRSTDYDEAYWDAYVAARPQYPSKLYDYIIGYHKEHNPDPATWSVAHDVGTGPGQMAGELCKYFKHVVGSDANETHTAVAAIRLRSLESQLSWSNLAAEELGNNFPRSSVNLVAVMEAIPLMDIPRATSSFTKLLAPNGTLAIVHYGRAHFYDDKEAPVLQPLLDKILALIVAGPLPEAPESQQAFWKRASDTVYSQLDNVPFPGADWHDVRRHKWNPHLPIAAFDASDAPFDFEYRTAIDESKEKVIIEQDPLFWREDWSFKEVKAYCECQLPNLKALQANKSLWSQVEEQYDLLEKAMAGEKKTLYLPAVLLLATRK